MMIDEFDQGFVSHDVDRSTYVACTLSLSPDPIGVTGLSDRRHRAHYYAEQPLFQTTRSRRIDH